MTRPRTDRLHVNLSASQTRKRLKGHGFGVKRVESVDRNQAVIIHTATGGHLEQLKSLFSDVARSAPDGVEFPPETKECLRSCGMRVRTCHEG